MPLNKKHGIMEDYRAKVTEDGIIHIWPRCEKTPPYARRDVCPQCLKERGIVQRLKIEKVEYPGKNGKVRRDYVCPVCGYKGQPVRRQSYHLSKDTLKEPDFKNKGMK